ncbi:hypothetical protein, partial [Maribellus maritimus]|uniref:hypothetical protein n=1 Tax=Maribellus maritimus TaxID=2870838 RepID=UPI001EEAEFC2
MSIYSILVSLHSSVITGVPVIVVSMFCIQSTVISGGQTSNTGGVESFTVIIWMHESAFPQLSV